MCGSHPLMDSFKTTGPVYMSPHLHLNLLWCMKAHTSEPEHVHALVSSRQPCDDGGVDTGLAVYLMSSDTQKAADTTQSQSEILTSHNCSDGSSLWQPFKWKGKHQSSFLVFSHMTLLFKAKKTLKKPAFRFFLCVWICRPVRGTFHLAANEHFLGEGEEKKTKNCSLC